MSMSIDASYFTFDSDNASVRELKLNIVCRKKLIEGSRGILQGTSALLLCFDESEVRKIVKECKKVLDYLGVAEVIDTMEDLVQFLRDISPALSRAAREVAARAAELTHPPHAETLNRCLDSVKQLAPVLICSMKIYIHILTEASDLRHQINELDAIVNEGVRAAEKQGGKTMQARLETAHKWLLHPAADPVTRVEGQKAINSIVSQGQRIADGLQGREKAEVLQLCSEVQRLSDKLADLCASGKGDTEEARAITRELTDKLHELKRATERAVVNRVVEDFIDVAAPLRHFTDAVNAPPESPYPGTPGRESHFHDKAAALAAFSARAAAAAGVVAAGVGHNKRLADQLIHNAQQVEKLSPQLIAAGKIRLYNPDSKVAEEHFNNLKNQYADAVLRVRDLCDQAVDPLDFVRTAALSGHYAPAPPPPALPEALSRLHVADAAAPPRPRPPPAPRPRRAPTAC
ncbi:hypothetical protein HF086_017589 [Spodoptera exigua]|uniref:Vinculin n=1 Tax=Spodoptera exigua TaxID=7107 RepID=A0A922MJ64_SPOEX|nr:hypothetical protein HF086_017589 [Spodoptera exigua]